jgi:hypothetical protein
VELLHVGPLLFRKFVLNLFDNFLQRNLGLSFVLFEVFNKVLIATQREDVGQDSLQKIVIGLVILIAELGAEESHDFLWIDLAEVARANHQTLAGVPVVDLLDLYCEFVAPVLLFLQLRTKLLCKGKQSFD